MGQGNSPAALAMAAVALLTSVWWVCASLYRYRCAAAAVAQLATLDTTLALFPQVSGITSEATLLFGTVIADDTIPDDKTNAMALSLISRILEWETSSMTPGVVVFAGAQARKWAEHAVPRRAHTHVVVLADLPSDTRLCKAVAWAFLCHLSAAHAAHLVVMDAGAVVLCPHTPSLLQYAAAKAQARSPAWRAILTSGRAAGTLVNAGLHSWPPPPSLPPHARHSPPPCGVGCA
eukprot:CAMPEP_0177657790 /NCGR_PEP_ID=MMETSP0447-20121125/16413_1 /TAXON_ID=0 /ORGANISM="Stygamoeba regulata, Strain BSH-02190019" /LENGTH=233 /DNA_ID=CAMNT_0019162249 /DNA_START=261 /DNA_END=959 /DNA_ORIENTATION=-